MAGYSGTPLPQKLGVKPGCRLGLVNAPAGFAQTLGELPARAPGLAIGLVDNKVCAIDDTWSGLRFVVRLKDRPAAKK